MKIMSQVNENLKNVLGRMRRDMGIASAHVSPSLAPVLADYRLMLSLVGAGLCSLLGLAGLLSSLPVMAAVGSIGALACSAAALVWGSGRARPGQRAPEIAFELIRRKSAEVEVSRLRQVVEEAHQVIEKLQNEMARERTRSRENLTAREEELLGMLKKAEQANEALEKRLCDQEVAWSQKFQGFERHLRDGSLKALEAEYNQSKAQMAQEHQNRVEAVQREGAERQAAREAAFLAEKAGLLEELEHRAKEAEDLGRKIVALQEASDARSITNSSELAGRLEEARKAFETRIQAAQQKSGEKEEEYKRLLAEQEDQFKAKQLELLSACETYLQELEEREGELEKRERASRRPQAGGVHGTD